MPANIKLDPRNSDYKGAVRRLEQLVAKTAYRPTVRRTGESSFLVSSHTDVFTDYKVVFFGRNSASCQCDAFKCCVHIVAAEKEKNAPIETGDASIHSMGGDRVFFACDRRDPDRGVRPAVLCGCGAVASHGYRCKACHAIWQAELRFDAESLEKARADIFG